MLALFIFEFGKRPTEARYVYIYMYKYIYISKYDVSPRVSMTFQSHIVYHGYLLKPLPVVWWLMKLQVVKFPKSPCPTGSSQRNHRFWLSAYPILGKTSMTLVFYLVCFMNLSPNLVQMVQGKEKDTPPSPHVIIIYHELLQLWAVPGQHLQGIKWCPSDEWN